MNIQIPISIGEFLDRLTILELKHEHAPDGALKDGIQDQINQFNDAAAPVTAIIEALTPLRRELGAINAQLWTVEDDLRAKESAQVFDEEFITLARSVYRLNDQRAALKKQMDQQVGSDFSDAKIYRSAPPDG
ncbi:MAG: DUF6165 family protein [Paracoccaceae bacterium]